MKFKKLAALTLAGAMSLSLAACGGGGGDTASPAPNTGSPSAATIPPRLRARSTRSASWLPR